MTIAGEQVRGRELFAVIDPATGEPFASAPDCPDLALESAVRAAETSFVSWAADEPYRRRALADAARRIEAAAQELGPPLTREQGKPLPAAVGEVLSASEWL